MKITNLTGIHTVLQLQPTNSDHAGHPSEGTPFKVLGHSFIDWLPLPIYYDYQMSPKGKVYLSYHKNETVSDHKLYGDPILPVTEELSRGMVSTVRTENVALMKEVHDKWGISLPSSDITNADCDAVLGYIESLIVPSALVGLNNHEAELLGCAYTLFRAYYLQFNKD